MTTIIAKKNDNGTVDLGWDSLVSPSGNSYPKVTMVNNQFYFGGAGHLRFLNIVQMAEVPEIHPAEFKDPEFGSLEYIVQAVVPAWIEALEKTNKTIPDSKEDWPWGVGLVILKGEVFHIGHDFAVSRSEGNFGVGSGADYALGALAAGKSVERALQIAESLDLSTGGQLHVLKGVK